MRTRTTLALSLSPVAAAVVGALLLGAGCAKSPAQAGATAAPGELAALPAPFKSPPMIAGAPDVATLVANVKPAVVNITTVHEARAPRGMDLPFPFGGQGSDGDGDRVVKQTALGSGFLIDAEGHVVTNAHVVDGADTVRVRLADDREFSARVVGRDKKLDLAVLKLEGDGVKNLPATSLGSSDALRVGEYVVAIGNPFGLGDTVTMGIVSAKGRAIGAGPYDDFIQTDASINPGNSGGPLFDLHGQVVGINTAINPNGQGIGFAIPIDMVRDVLPQLIATGHVERGKLGVIVQPMDNELATALGLDRPHGALVGDTEKGSPAARAGVKAGDVVLAVDGKSIDRFEDLPRAIARHAPGTSVTLALYRDKAKLSVPVTLDPMDAPNVVEAAAHVAPATHGLGVRLQDSSDGAMVEGIVPGGSAEGALVPGDVILEVNRAPVTHASEVADRINAANVGDAILLKVQRRGIARFVAVEKK
jgi:serine protease Do